MAKQPAFQFYPGDWRKDTALRMCSPAARGAWMDMLCLMFESAECGVLITNGRTWTEQQIARECGCDLEHVHELLDNGVARRRDDGAIYSPRMVRDAELREERARAGKAGGKQKPKQTASKTPSKTEAKPQANGKQKGKQNRPPSSSSSSASSSSSSPPPACAGSPPAAPEVQAGSGDRDEAMDGMLDAVIEWAGGQLARSSAVPIVTDLLRAVESNPIVPPDGPAPTETEVVMALVRTMRAQPDAPQPTNRARVRQYAGAVMLRCAAEGTMPGEFEAIAAKPKSTFAGRFEDEHRARLARREEQSA